MAEVRVLTERFKAGGSGAADGFRELANLLLRSTVAADTGWLQLQWAEAHNNLWVLGGPDGPTDPIELRDARYLRVAMTLYLDPESNRLKVKQSSFQYELPGNNDEWLFRYDYLRELGSSPYPTSHLNVNGHFPEFAGDSISLPKIHFPVMRPTLEGVIRLLADGFGVGCAEPVEVWRPMVAASEEAFYEIAHTPLSGPEGRLPSDVQD